MATDTWNPAQYGKFGAERSQPFYDLLDMVAPMPASPARAIDLGCGTGALTRVMHERLGLAETIGLDSSSAMLQAAAAVSSPGLRFMAGDIATFEDGSGFDLVFSNAALQWVPGHEQLFAQLAAMVRPGGQIAVQMPANDDHISHALAHRVAATQPFAEALGGYTRASYTQAPEWYAQRLFDLGFGEQSVRMQVYPHVLGEAGDVVEWVKGSLLTDYEKRMAPGLFSEYVARYREELVRLLGDARPFFYPFKRVLLWGRMPA